MSRAIICLVFVIVLSSTSDGRFIDKRSSGGASDFGDQINKAGDFDSDAIQSAIQSAMEEKLKDAFSKDAGSAIGDFFGGLGRKKEIPESMESNTESALAFGIESTRVLLQLEIFLQRLSLVLRAKSAPLNLNHSRT